MIVGASLAGMLLLPLCYTTGLILTNPTVASVWDGPMIPLGVFFTAVSLGAERMSRKRPMGQVLSLLLTVGGSIIVLLVDFLGAHNSIKDEDGATIGHASHWEFIRGNIVLMGIAGAYSATSLLQKRLTHYPPITLTSWMFASGFVNCCCLLLVDSALYSLRGTSITGCSLGQAISQLSIALSTSPTFRYGVVYAAFFVGGACFTIMSYASSHLDASIITLFAAIQPPITAVLEWIWEGKELGFKKILGMICVGIGMMSFTHIKKLEGHHHRHRWPSQNGHHSKRTR
jgi:drug/metabolite transporter (DMT)-like permease